jgi:hypothetical protein
MGGKVETLGAEDRLLLGRFRDRPAWLVALLAGHGTFFLLLLLAAILAPAYKPRNYYEGYSLFNQLIPFIALAALLWGGLSGYLAGTITRSIEYGNLPANEFKKSFLARLTAAEDWAVEMVSEKYMLCRKRKTQVLIHFGEAGVMVKCQSRLMLRMKGIAAQVQNPVEEEKG